MLMKYQNRQGFFEKFKKKEWRPKLEYWSIDLLLKNFKKFSFGVGVLCKMCCVFWLVVFFFVYVFWIVLHLSFLKVMESFRFCPQKKSAYFLVQTVQLIFSNANKLLSDTQKWFF